MVPHVAEGPTRMENRHLRLWDLQFSVVGTAGIQCQTIFALLRLETGVTSTTELRDVLQEMTVSLRDQRVEKVNDVHEGNFSLLCIFNSVKKLSKWQSVQTPDICHNLAPTMHMAMKEPSPFRAFRKLKLWIENAKLSPSLSYCRFDIYEQLQRYLCRTSTITRSTAKVRLYVSFMLRLPMIYISNNPILA